MNVHLGVVWGAVLVAAGTLAPFLLRRKDPKEKERRRRQLVSARGRVIEGYAIESTDTVVVYTYHWRGVRYEAAQDISDFVPPGVESERLSGAVTVKFLREAPANSIVLAEDWSGVPGLRSGAKPR
ncbi:MAG TPA: hypothetical protein VER03_14790 [Bryobacteraceae bacterium]|nr:hypothetical protein [Bryobacteraceae bacterium]